MVFQNLSGGKNNKPQSRTEAHPKKTADREFILAGRGSNNG
jgi:hypothetical protein